MYDIELRDLKLEQLRQIMQKIKPARSLYRIDFENCQIDKAIFQHFFLPYLDIILLIDCDITDDFDILFYILNEAPILRFLTYV